MRIYTCILFCEHQYSVSALVQRGLGSGMLPVERLMQLSWDRSLINRLRYN